MEPRPLAPRVVVVGSSNTDMVARAPRLPRPGETVLGGAFASAPGGKGANQAVAAARLGAQVTLVARIGQDALGDAALRGFEAEGIDTQFVVRDPDAPSGVALIGVAEDTGENAIIVAPGANANLSVADIMQARDAIRGADVLACQLETPLETVGAALEMARSAGVTTILNPAPAQVLPLALLTNVSVLTPNEIEAALLAGPGARTPAQIAHGLRQQGVGSVVMTLGANGALASTEVADTPIAPFMSACVMDTTAAGACKTVALAVALAEGRNLERAARFACAAASLSVEAKGAQPSLPTRAAVDARANFVEQ